MNVKPIFYFIVFAGLLLLVGFFLSQQESQPISPPFPPQTNDNLSELSALNSKTDLPQIPLHLSADKVFSLDSEKLEKLKQELIAYNLTATNSRKAISDIYIKFVNFVLLYKNTEKINQEINEKSPFCSNLPNFREINSNYKTLVQLQQEISDAITIFFQNYPQESLELDLSLNSFIGLTATFSQQNTKILKLAESECN